MRRTFQISSGPSGPRTAAETYAGQSSQADRDRLAADRATAEQAASEIRDYLRKLIEFVWADGRDFADQLSLKDDEKDFLDQQEKGLVRAQVELEQTVSLIASPTLRYGVYRSVRELLWHGANMARFARPPDAIERGQALEETDRRKKEARRRGEASGASRRATAAAGWQKAALELAQASRTANPTLSQDALATRIKDRWKQTNPPLPSHQTLIKFISKCEGDGKLTAGES